MYYPQDFVTEINEGKNSLVEIIMINRDSDEINNNLISWSVIKASSTGMEIRVNFEKAITVSTGYSPDLLIV